MSSSFFFNSTIKKSLSFLVILLVLLIPVIIYCETGHSEDIKDGNGIRNSIKLKTIIVDNYYPYTFANYAGEPDGFSVDLIKAVTKAMNAELSIQVDQWDKAKNSLANGTIDFLPMMAYSKDRDKHFDFSVPHTVAYDAIFTRKNGSKIKTLSDLRNKTIIVMPEDQAHDYLRHLKFISHDQLLFSQSIPDALLKLSSGEGDAALIPKLVGLVRIKKMNLVNLELSPILIEDYQRPFSFAVKEGNQNLLERLTQGLLIIKENGQYASIYKKWFGAYQPLNPFWSKFLKFTLWGLGAVITFCIILLFWSASLKRQVNLKTKSLRKEIQTREFAELELQKAHDKLEFRVMERTRELEATNKQLHSEILERKQIQAEKEKLIMELQESMDNIKLLSGLLPICSNCKKIRDDKGYWNHLELYIETHTEAMFTHSVCPKCMDEIYGSEDWYVKGKRND